MTSPRRGVTLVETLVVTVLAGVAVAVAQGSLWRAQRFYRSQPQVLDVQRGLRAAAELLAAELRGLDPSDGDIVAISDTAITIKVPRALGILCAPPDGASGRVLLADRLTFGFRAVDPARDSALLFREGDTLRADDDRWVRAGVGAVSTAACPDGSPGTRLVLAAAAGAADLAGVFAGAPLRTFEVVRYRLYEDGSRTWWLGQQSYGGGWSATTPLAGPLRARDGLRLTYTDAAGAPTMDPTAVRAIGVTVRGRSLRPVDTPGRRSGAFVDSLTTAVAPRNGARP